jgi:hypothetical protein
LGIVAEDGGVIVFVNLLISVHHESPPGVGIFLQTDDICLLALKVIVDGIEALLVFVVASILADVVGYDLE